MKTILHLLLGLALCGCAMAQTKAVIKTASGNDLTESLNVPSGKTLTIEDGATINAAAGSIINGFGSGSGLTNFASTVTGGTLTFAGTLTTGRTLTWRDLAGTVALTSDLSSYQPLDSDLTAIAALTTATFGRSLLEGADAAAVRTLLALGTAAQMNATASEGSGSQVSLASHTHNLGGTQVTGTLPITKGGTGLVDTPTNGQLLIGNTATNAWARATLTGGNGITITNGNASISIAVNLGTLSGTVPVANGGTGITSFGTGVATWLGTPSSSNLASAVTGETGSGALVFGTSPTLAGTVTIAQGTITDPAAALSITSTWNDAADTMRGVEINITETAANFDSTLMRLRLSGSDKVVFDRYGSITTPTGGINTRAGSFGVFSEADLTLNTVAILAWGGDGSLVPKLVRDADQVLALVGTTDPMTFRIYETKTDGSNYERLSISAASGTNVIKPEAAGTGTASRVEYHTTSTGVKRCSGAGSPEGVVTAPPGSIYTNETGGAGVTLYVKESGTGNTGWVAK